MGIIVSPTEPPQLRAIASSVSMFPEKYGCDAIWRVHAGDKERAGWVGVQRKELGDLLSSVRDGRLGQQLRQMAPLKIAVVIIEGKIKWSTSGELVHGSTKDYSSQRPWTRKQIAGVLWSVQSRGVWVTHTESLGETIQTIEMFEDWSGKDNHSGLESRSGPEGDGWGQVRDRDWQRHILTGLPGVGQELATRILDRYGFPLGIREGVDLRSVHGLGPKKLAEIERIINHQE